MNPYYDDGQIQIFEGDALDVLPQLKANSAKLVLTDPPYVIGAVSAGNLATKAGGWADMMNSSRWFRDWYAMCRRILRQDGAMWTFCNWRSLPVVMKAGADIGWGITSVLVWDKQWIGPGGTVGLRPRYELVALFAMPEFAIPDRGTSDILAQMWSANKPTGHPAEKPVPLLRQILDLSGAVADDVIVDPFSGSGSTMRAVKDAGLQGIAVEQEERWCEVSARRLEQAVLPLAMAD